LYFGIKPIIVFDGQTPALKRKCVIDRQTQRNDADVKKAAEKLLTSVLFNRSRTSDVQSDKISSESESDVDLVNESLLDKYRELLESEVLAETGRTTDLEWLKAQSISD
jgi:predicted KAP-like P-loop ATPase